MTPYKKLLDARSNIWRNLPSGPCIKCAEEAMSKLVGDAEAADYGATVRPASGLSTQTDEHGVLRNALLGHF